MATRRSTATIILLATGSVNEDSSRPRRALRRVHGADPGDGDRRLWILVGVAAGVVFLLVALALDDLLRDVDRRLARLMVMLVGVSATLGMMNVVLLCAPAVLSGGASFLAPFTSEQLDALAYAFLRLRSLGTGVAMVFWGLWLFPFGRLVSRSGFLSSARAAPTSSRCTAP